MRCYDAIMKITEIAFTGYPVTDMRRARAFYEGVLKLESSRDFGDGEKKWIEYDLGTTTFAISNMSADDWKPSNNGPSIAFEVDDFDAAVASLKENKVQFRAEPFESPICQMAIVTDPDGNSIVIHKRKSL
jgi:predicted enzyme related to lactoylglutathione lyase